MSLLFSFTSPDRLGHLVLAAVAQNMTNLAEAEAEFFANRFRAITDLSRVVQVRLVGNVSTAGTATSEIRLQWSVDQVEWNEFQATNEPLISIGAIGVIDSGWVAVPSGARGEVFLRLTTAGGDGVADPVVGRIDVLLR